MSMTLREANIISRIERGMTRKKSEEVANYSDTHVSEEEAREMRAVIPVKSERKAIELFKTIDRCLDKGNLEQAALYVEELKELVNPTSN